jgi:hypothetical protein
LLIIIIIHKKNTSVYAVLRIVSFGQWSSLIGGEHCHLQNVDPIFYLNIETHFLVLLFAA